MQVHPSAPRAAQCTDGHDGEDGEKVVDDEISKILIFISIPSAYLLLLQ